MGSINNPKSDLTVIVPILNEEKSLHARIKEFDFLKKNHDLIFVDGGSNDDSVSILESNGHKVIISQQKGRGMQIALGAEHSLSKSKYLLFLHIDTKLPANHDSQIRDAFDNSDWGFFKIRLDSSKLIFRIIEKLMNIRSSLTNIATGDQTIFVRKAIFMECIDEVKAHPIMEDIYMSNYFKKQNGKAFVIKNHVTTSTRYWNKHGVINTIQKMWKFRPLYYIGTSPVDLYQRNYAKQT